MLEPTACIFIKKRPRTGVSGGFHTTPEIQKWRLCCYYFDKAYFKKKKKRTKKIEWFIVYGFLMN